jgi:hypothetical protein
MILISYVRGREIRFRFQSFETYLRASLNNYFIYVENTKAAGSRKAVLTLTILFEANIVKVNNLLDKNRQHVIIFKEGLRITIFNL